MSNCPFLSNKKEFVSCYADCPMMQLKAEDEDCVFKTYSTGSGVSFKNIKIVEKFEDDIEEEDKFIKRFKVNSSY